MINRDYLISIDYDDIIYKLMRNMTFFDGSTFLLMINTSYYSMVRKK